VFPNKWVFGYHLSNANNNCMQSTPFTAANVVEFDKLQCIGLKPNGIDFYRLSDFFNE